MKTSVIIDLFSWNVRDQLYRFGNFTKRMNQIQILNDNSIVISRTMTAGVMIICHAFLDEEVYFKDFIKQSGLHHWPSGNLQK